MVDIEVAANGETALHEFIIKHKTTNKQYKRDVNGQWSEL